MKLRHSNYRLFYSLCLGAVSVCMALAICSCTHNTYAEEDFSVNYSTISGSHFVTIYDDGNSVTVKTDAATVREVLERTDVSVDDSDIVDPGLDSEINSDNYRINIHRARPVVVTDGHTKKYLMSASYDHKTIAESAGFTVYDGDDIELSGNSNDFLETGSTSTYTISHNGGSTITVEEDIPFEEVTEVDYDLESGKEELKQVGELGRKSIKYQVNFVDGEEVSREVISETIVKEPQKRIVSVGMKRNASIPAEWDTCAMWARQAGVSESDLSVALTLIYKESGCRYNASNGHTGAYGIPQALPGSKMSSAGSDWQTNPVTQIRWMAGYVKGRYGGWNGAWSHWSSHHWY